MNMSCESTSLKKSESGLSSTTVTCLVSEFPDFAK